MIVIEGRVGKSRIIEEMLNKRFITDSVMILDNVGVKNLSVPEGTMHILLEDYTVEDVVGVYESIENSHNWHSSFDWVIFEINLDTSKCSLDFFKHLDRKTNKNLVITVQTQTDDIKVKFY